jgi:hypothetical protein
MQLEQYIGEKKRVLKHIDIAFILQYADTIGYQV